MHKLRILILLTVFCTGCSQVKVSDYSSMRPALQPEQFFNGQLSAHGLVKDRSGKVTRTFNATINAYWQDGIGTLEEEFIFDDGEKQQRTWKLKRQSNGGYLASANDVVGEAPVEVAGNSMFLKYVLQIPFRGKTLNITIDDRMYLVSETVLLNESNMSKWGIDVGSLTLTIIKASDKKPS